MVLGMTSQPVVVNCVASASVGHGASPTETFSETNGLARSSFGQHSEGGKMSDLRFPVGKFSYAGPLDEPQKRQCIDEIAEAPENLRAAVKGLSNAQLDTPYRPEGWTVQQVVHHMPDSHLNAYTRFKLALTEDDPTIKTYAEDRWAELPDSKATPIEVSLTLLDSLHDRWVRLLRSLNKDEWKRTFRHPELGPMTLEKTLALYAWHGRHHVAHVTELRKRMSW